MSGGIVPGPAGSVDTAAAGLRAQLVRLDGLGLLARVGREADPRFEIAALARACDTGPALLFERVAGSGRRVVIGTESSRTAVAASLGVDPGLLSARYLHAIEHPLAPVVVGEGPVQETVLLGDEIDLTRELPILTHHEKDAGPYVTSGVVIAEDPGEGVRNLSYHRMQVTGPRETRMVIVRRHLHRLYERAEREGRALPVAVVLGLDAATRLAAGTSGSMIPFGYDELGLAGALRAAPVPLVRGITVPVHYPADAEIVIEGEIPAGIRAEEGPFAEFDGTYESGESHVFRVTGLVMRRDAIYQGLLSGAREQLNLMGLANEAVILRGVRGTVPGVRSVNVTVGGLRKFHAIVSVDKQHDGDGKDAIVAAMAAHRDVKHVVVVDSDVDPHDPLQVEWAIATRFQADEDLVVVSGGRGNAVDKSTRSGRTSRMGLDATVPLSRRSSGEATRAHIPGENTIDTSDWLTPGGSGTEGA